MIRAELDASFDGNMYPAGASYHKDRELEGWGYDENVLSKKFNISTVSSLCSKATDLTASGRSLSGSSGGHHK